jgi:hypothetical protein
LFNTGLKQGLFCRLKEKKMAKKIVLALLMAALATGVTFAQSGMSAGAGGLIRANFSNYAWTKDGKDMLGSTDTNIYDTNYVGGGFFAFLDTTYLAVSLGLGIHGVTPANSDAAKAQKDAKVTQTLTTFDIGFLGKYPVDMGGLTVFPAFGVDFRIGLDLVYKYDGGESKFSDSSESPAEWLTTVWIKFGGGADIPLSDTFYLRPMFLYGIGTLNKMDKETSDDRNKSKTYYTQINHGFDISLAVGYRF